MVVAVESFRYTCWLLPVGLVFAVASGAPQPRQRPLTPEQQGELKTYRLQLADPERTAKTKLEAANLLLGRSYPQATTLLVEFLSDPANRPARIAIAEAIAESGKTRPELVAPLLAMLTGEDEEVRPCAANALTAFKDDGVLDELIKLASDRKTERSIRLVVITAMQRVLDKRAIDALVRLVSDRDEDIRGAACDVLGKLTHIRAFGRQPRQWRTWWAKSKDKPRSEWLADLADNLTRTNIDLEKENADLRRRLAAAMRGRHDDAAEAKKDAVLTEMLEYPVASVRLAGAMLVQERLASGKPLSEALQEQVAAMVGDASPAVRREAALTLANLGGERAVKVITERLDAEQTSEVREVLYQAVGLLREVGMWDRLVKGIEKEERRAAAEAAAALARIAERNGPDIARRAAAAEALRKRYRAAGSNSAVLRENLLAAMGPLKDKQLSGLLTSALKDPAATIRLRGIEGLQKLSLPEGSAAVAPLINDPDRGVRRAAISAVGALGGAKHLADVMGRTNPAVEPDAAVRQQAWTVAMALWENTSPGDLRKLAKQLEQRADAREYLIQLLKLLLGKIPAGEVGAWAPVRLQLGEALLEAGRPAEAVGELSTVHAALLKAGGADAPKVWRKWIEALLAADDVSAVQKIAAERDADQFAAAVDALTRRVNALKADKEWDSLVRLGRAAEQRLAKRLDDARRKWLAESLREGAQQQQLEDRQRVAGLIQRLAGADEAARHAARKELTDMKARAVAPLVQELRKLLAGENPSQHAEKAILEVLSALAPQLKGYQPEAKVQDRLGTVEGWLKQLGS